MPRIRIIWTPNAQEDLAEIRRRIAKNSPRTAKQFIDRLRAAVRGLRDFPEIGPVAEEFTTVEVREIIHEGYRILYRNRLPWIFIVAVWDGGRPLIAGRIPVLQ